MVGRLWWLLVLGWAWHAYWPALASRGQCDVEALRCHVICSFPDLDVHCSRCIRRLPMRFGKRSGGALEPSGSEAWRSGGPLLSNLGSGTPRKARSHKESTSAMSKVQHGMLRRFPSEAAWIDDVKRGVPSEELQRPRASHLRARLYPGSLNEDSRADVDDSLDLRRRRRSVSVSPVRLKRSKRSSVLDKIEGLMELLGLEELPVDPTLHGCQELHLPFLK